MCRKLSGWPGLALTFLPSTAFRADLEARVDAFFLERGCSRRDARSMYLKTAVLLLWLAVSYLGLLAWASTWWQALPLAVSLGLAMAGVGFCVQHDGGHGAYSHRPWVNRVMALSLNLLGGSAYFWHFKHNIAHHSYPNVSGHDDDINVGPLGRLSPHDRRRRLHRYQQFYMWALYSLLAIEWQVSGDMRQYIRPGIAATRVPRPRGAERVIFWTSRMAFVGLAFVLPLLVGHRLGTVVALYIVTGMVLGLTLATVFQLAHCVPEAEFLQPEGATRRIDREWAAHQVGATVNFAAGSRVLGWYLGGLNHQIEHHLFPRICHVHYPALAPIVEQVCIAHGVRYVSHATFSSALRAHFRWLKRMGAAD